VGRIIAGCREGARRGHQPMLDSRETQRCDFGKGEEANAEDIRTRHVIVNHYMILM